MIDEKILDNLFRKWGRVLWFGKILLSHKHIVRQCTQEYNWWSEIMPPSIFARASRTYLLLQWLYFPNLCLSVDRSHSRVRHVSKMCLFVRSYGCHNGLICHVWRIYWVFSLLRKVFQLFVMNDTQGKICDTRWPAISDLCSYVVLVKVR